MISWTELAAAEPRLLDLEQAVRAEIDSAAGDPQWSFSRYWSWTLRPAIRVLVGWDAGPDTAPEVRTEAAWHTAISYLIDLFPVEESAWAS